MAAMNRRRRATAWGGGLLGLLGLALWHFAPLDAVQSLSTLTDPAGLRALGRRGANDRFNKISYWLDAADRGFLGSDRALRLAQMLNGATEPQATMVRTSLLHNLARARDLGLLAGEGPGRLRRGNGATISRGPDAGQPAEIDHIVPLHLAPEAGNELANLEFLAARSNRSKSDRVGSREIQYARRLAGAGLLSAESLARVEAAGGAGSRP